MGSHPIELESNHSVEKPPVEIDAQDQTVESVLNSDAVLCSVFCASSSVDVFWTYCVLARYRLNMLCNGRPVFACLPPEREIRTALEPVGICLSSAG